MNKRDFLTFVMFLETSKNFLAGDDFHVHRAAVLMK
jgi:hypothetical protein